MRKIISMEADNSLICILPAQTLFPLEGRDHHTTATRVTGLDMHLR